MSVDKSQLLQAMETGKKEGKEFIRWWRKENDFADFELIDRYLQANEIPGNVENFDLLDKDEMWEILKARNPDGLYHRMATHSDTIEWRHRDKDGEMQTYTCAYNAHSIMSIFDAETKGVTLV